LTKPFNLLRAALHEADINQEYLCELTGRSKTYITMRMNAKAPWSQNDMYFLMDLLNIPYNRMHEFFPKDGKPVTPELETKNNGTEVLVAIANAILKAVEKKKS